MKKFVISILCSLMLVSCVGFNIYAENPLGETPTEHIPDEYAAKVANIATNFAWAFSGGGKLLFGSCLAGGIVGIASLAIDLLGTVIYFGESTEEMQRQELMDKLSSIDASIGDVSSKVDSLTDQINASIKLIDSGLSDISIKLDKENITNVASIADSLKTKMDTYDNLLTTKIHNWYDYKIDEFLLLADTFVLKVPNGTKSSISVNDSGATADVDNTDTIYIDKSLMSSVINSYREEQIIATQKDGWDADIKDEIVKKIFKRIILNDNFDKSQDSQFDTWIKKIYPGYETWDDFSNKEEALNKIADAGYGTLCELAARNIAKSSEGTDTYVNNLVEKFNAYCNYLTGGENGEYTSPLVSYANIYSKIYAFQGDLKRTIELDERDAQGNLTGNKIKENTDLLKLTKEKYIAELNRLGTFVGIMAKASGNYGEKSDMRKLIYIPWAAAEQKLQDDYYSNYHTSFGEGIDNYCYITKSVLDYRYGWLTCDLVMKFYAWENGFGTDIKSYRDTYMAEDWAFSVDNSQIVDTTSMNLIYAHYANTNGNIGFKEYLTKNKTGASNYDGMKVPPMVITKFIGGRDFTSEDKVKMFIKNCHNNPDKWSGKDYLKGDTTTVTSSSSHFKIRKKATADVFDLTTGVSTPGKRIGAVASFYEKYTFKDDLVVFWDAEYNNPQTTQELKDLANLDNFYYRDRYDTSSDDEERYRSHVDYFRRYAVLLSYPLNSLSDPPVADNKDRKVYGTNKSHELKDNETDALEQALINAGVSKEEYEDFVYDDTYRVYFDESKYDGEINTDLYDKLIAFCQDQDNLDRMTEDYYDFNDQVIDMVDNIKNRLNISNNETIINEVAINLIENDLDCYVVDEVPSSNLNKNVYNSSNGKLYIWNNGSYVEYDSFASTKIKPNHPATPDDHEEHKDPTDDDPSFASSFETKIMNTGDYPCISSTNLSFEYQIKTVLAYELVVNNGTVDYIIHPIYDVIPVLKWKDGTISKQKEVSDKVLELSGINSMEILLPILELDNEGDNHAVINHYSDLEQMESPMEVLDSSIKTINGFKYGRLFVTSFSPYTVPHTYFKSNQKFKTPSTGIE